MKGCQHVGNELDNQTLISTHFIELLLLESFVIRLLKQKDEHHLYDASLLQRGPCDQAQSGEKTFPKAPVQVPKCFDKSRILEMGRGESTREHPTAKGLAAKLSFVELFSN